MPLKLNVKDIVGRKGGEKLVMLTAYDAATSSLVDQDGVDIILVGDSLGNVALGYESTVPVSMEEMLHHAAAVRRASSSFIVADMPFMSYQVDISKAICNSGRFLKEAGSDAVKIEGGADFAGTVKSVVQAGVPVMGHIGLTPQTASQLGGYKVQGRDAESARKLMRDARALEEAGAFAIVLECVPDSLARYLTGTVSIPTIGIGAGPDCDGQVLVSNDLLGLSGKTVPRFVKQYACLGKEAKDAVDCFINEVREGTFPAGENSFSLPVDVKSLLTEEKE
ncbi:MAG: 3-methyl-2-oxobutanoate hydroxymethyltransferase [Desulfurivibrionaceae bacterium]